MTRQYKYGHIRMIILAIEQALMRKPSFSCLRSRLGKQNPFSNALPRLGKMISGDEIHTSTHITPSFADLFLHSDECLKILVGLDALEKSR